jgi:hypothetical protein
MADDADELVFCTCAQECLPARQAYRLGCDEAGGCPELRDAMSGYGNGGD